MKEVEISIEYQQDIGVIKEVNGTVNLGLSKFYKGFFYFALTGLILGYFVPISFGFLPAHLNHILLFCFVFLFTLVAFFIEQKQKPFVMDSLGFRKNGKEIKWSDVKEITRVSIYSTGGAFPRIVTRVKLENEKIDINDSFMSEKKEIITNTILYYYTRAKNQNK